MNRNAGAVIEQADQYASLFDRVSAGGRFDDASSDGAIRLVSDQELLEAASSVSWLTRPAGAEGTKLAGETARRSEPRDETSLARRMGTSSASHLVAEVTGVPRSQAGTLVASGVAFRPQENAFTGEPLGAKYPKLAAAFAAGLLDPEVAAALRRALSKAAPGLAPYEVDDLEAKVLAVATEGWDAEFLLAYAKKVPEMAHPGFGAPQPEGPAPLPSVTRHVLENGLVYWQAHLDAVTDGLLKAAIDANTAMKRPLLNTGDEPPARPAPHDRRPLEQRRVDGLRLLAKKALKMDEGQVGGTAVTMLVTITEQALRTGLGMAQLPDCGTEISASVARMLASYAEIIPVVLGGKSQTLDLGWGA